MSDEQKEPDRTNSVMRELVARGVKRCLRCNGTGFSIPGETRVFVQESPEFFQAEQETVPCAIVICITCGFVHLHALKALHLKSQFGD